MTARTAARPTGWSPAASRRGWQGTPAGGAGAAGRTRRSEASEGRAADPMMRLAGHAGRTATGARGHAYVDEHGPDLDAQHDMAKVALLDDVSLHHMRRAQHAVAGVQVLPCVLRHQQEVLVLDRIRAQRALAIGEQVGVVDRARRRAGADRQRRLGVPDRTHGCLPPIPPRPAHDEPAGPVSSVSGSGGRLQIGLRVAALRARAGRGPGVSGPQARIKVLLDDAPLRRRVLRDRSAHGRMGRGASRITDTEIGLMSSATIAASRRCVAPRRRPSSWRCSCTTRMCTRAQCWPCTSSRCNSNRCASALSLSVGVADRSGGAGCDRPRDPAA